MILCRISCRKVYYHFLPAVKSSRFHASRQNYANVRYSTSSPSIKSNPLVSNKVNSSGENHKNEEERNDPLLETLTEERDIVPIYSEVVPGKGPPPEPPVDCCMSGCANCVWIQYAEEIKKYYSKDGNERAKQEIDKIENPSLKMFVKLELGLL